MVSQIRRDQSIVNAKSILHDFFYNSVKQIDLLEKLRRFRTICHRLKRRFTNVLMRRRHKIMVLSEYWTALAETCYFLKQFKKKSMVEGYRGHKFIKITKDTQLKVIRKYLEERDRQYIT